MSKSIEIMGFKFPIYTLQDLSDWTEKALLGSKTNIVAKAPAEFLVRAGKDPDFKHFLEETDLIVPDGIGILWAARYLKIPVSSNKIVRTFQSIWQMTYTLLAIIFRPSYLKTVLPERLSGVEALKAMLLGCERANKSVYFYGSQEKVLSESIKVIKSKYPKLVIAGSHDGYSGANEEMIKDINNAKPQLLIVSLGSPKQEYWIRDNISKLATVMVAVGEGGSLDAIAGTARRSPKFLQKIGLEWLWRGLFVKNLSGRGHRFRRIWDAVPVFIVKVVKYKISNG